MAQTSKSISSVSRYLLWLIFLIYCVVLVKIIVIKKPAFFVNSIRQTWRHGGYHKSSATQNWVPLKNIKGMLSANVTSRTAMENVGGNILIFIPFGIMVPLLLRSRYKYPLAILLGFLLSVFFESFQLYTGCGQFDVDDIILNTSGALTGVVILMFANYIFQKDNQDSINKVLAK